MLNAYLRNQKLLDRLKMSLTDLYNRKALLTEELNKIEIQITKHDQYIKKLTKND